MSWMIDIIISSYYDYDRESTDNHYLKLDAVINLPLMFLVTLQKIVWTNHEIITFEAIGSDRYWFLFFALKDSEALMCCGVTES